MSDRTRDDSTAPLPTSVVETINRAADHLRLETDAFSVEPTTDWIATHGLSKNGEGEEIVARQAAFTAVLRAAFIASETPTDASALTPETYDRVITEHAAVQRGFPKWFLLDAIVEHADPDVFASLVEARTAILGTANPSERIGELYEVLVGQEERWRLGQFRTPPVIAETMAAAAIGDAEVSVLAPGMGAGALAHAAAEEKTARGNETAGNDIQGVETSALSLLMGGTAFAVSDIAGTPSLVHDDFFGISERLLESTDVVISNPPYTRHHELDSDLKQQLNEQAAAEAGQDFSMLSPLSVYFTVHATEFLTDGGTAVFLTPADLLSTEYGESWKAFLLSEYDIQGFLWFDQSEMSYFDEARTTSLITVATKSSDPVPDSPTRFVHVKEYPGAGELVSALTGTSTTPVSWGDVNSVQQSELDPTDDWDTEFTQHEIDVESIDELVPFGEIGRVSRGIATGQNSFFCLSEADRVGSANAHDWDIGTEYLAPIVRQAQSVPYYDYQESDWEAQRSAGKEVWLLYHLDELDWDSSYFAEELQDDATTQNQLSSYVPGTSEDATGADSDVVPYLKAGMETENPPHTTHIGQHRNPWYVVDRRDPPPILYTSMSRGRGRFVYNKMGVRNLNNLHCIYFDVDLSEQEVKALLAYLNSSFASRIVKRSGRTLSSGMDKIEPNDLEEIPVIDPRSLREEVIGGLADAFDDLCAAARDDGRDEAVVREDLQEALRSILELDAE